MICPACSSQLEHHDPEPNLSVDHCSRCGGIWFDSGEVVPYFQSLIRREVNLPEPGPTAPKAKSVKEVKEDERKCPGCREPMRKFNYGYDSNVILDKCDKCGGVWVDGSEVKPLATFLKGSSKG